MIHFFQRLSIRRKLTLVMLFISLIAVLLSSGTLFAYHTLYLRKTLVRELSMDAEIIAANSSAAMAFKDKKAAREILKALKERPHIVRAALFDTSGNIVADYRAAGAGATETLPRLQTPKSDHHFEAGHLWVFRQIYLDGDLVGNLALLCTLRDQNHKVAVSAAIMLLALTIAGGITIVLSIKLQGLISDPLQDLARLAKKVSDKKDYSLRLSSDAEDEIGVLVQGINGMLSEIQKRDMELRTSEERFRQLAETIQEVFWIADAVEEKILYVSPAYETIWGRSCSQLYQSAHDWLAAIHPDDRGRVVSAYRNSRIKYDEEYRILRPDGSTRWIHDRAFGITDETGKVYRIAGIAEDITVRKQLEKQILEISDREQSRIGQDLHDGLCQHLVRIGFAANVLRNDLLAQNHPHCPRAKKICDLVDESISQARNLARGLYPVKLETEGLRSSLEELAAKVRDEHSVGCEVDCPADFEVKDHPVAIHLYRIVQEAVTNAIKHAHPNLIGIRLCREGEKFILTISDDGVGMSSRQTGMGINIMNYRARMIGAILEIQARPGVGTLVSCTVHSDCPKMDAPPAT